jgi:predicted amidohydrolase
MAPRLDDVEANERRIAAGIRDAAKAGARLVVFPECALTGYVFESREESAGAAQSIPGPSTETMASVCSETGIFTIYGLIERASGRLHNTAVLVGPRGVLARYRKVHLPAMGADRFLDCGDEPFQVVELPELKLRIGLQICYDGAFPEPARVQALEGADLIVLPTNWPSGAEALAEHLMPCRAIENVVYTAAVNRVGEERGVGFIGRSGIYDPFGHLLARADATSEQLLLAELDPARARCKRIVRAPGRMEFDRIADRRPEFYGPITER